MSDQPQRPPRSYRDLLAWQKGMLPAKGIYSLTTRFPKEERYGLISPMHRTAVSVPSNHAEGQARRTRGEFVPFISHAEGLIQELRKMLNALRRTVSNNSSLKTHN